MTKRRRRNRNGGSTATSRPRTPHGRHPVRTGAILVVMLAAAGMAGWGLWRVTHAAAAPPAEPLVAAGVTGPPAAAAQTNSAFQQLRGRWVRPDGGYIVDVKNVEDGGAMDVSYFNPRSIHVARARAWRDGAAAKVFIELRDVNYPGSTYTLTYDPQADRLEGIYYQAALQESFEVVFLRAN